MKNDQQFLEGIYKKAEELITDKGVSESFEHKTKISFLRKYAGIAVAALLIAVIAPSLYFGLNRNYEMVEPVVAQKSLQAAPRITEFSVEHPVYELADKADVVAIAKVKNIEKSVYVTDGGENNNMTTTVNLKISSVLDGTVDNKSIKVVVDGGYDQKTSNYIPYEAIFKKNETNLLFLTVLEDNEYTLTDSAFGQYKIVDSAEQEGIFIGKDGNTITEAEITQIIK